MERLTGRLSPAQSLTGRLSPAQALTGCLTIPEGALPPYEGSCEVTPTGETQILHTAGRGMSEDIRILPIPSNYGLITWNGSTLTVS